MGAFTMRPFLITAFLSLCGVSAASADAYKAIKDFEVLCSAAVTCRIQTLAKSPAQPVVASFSMVRKAGPDAPLDLVLTTQDELKPGSAVAFAADGKTVLTLPVAKARRSEDGEYSFAGDAETLKLLDALRKASKLELTYVSAAGEGRSTFSLSGLVGSLIFVDEAQDRLKARDALQVKGEGASPTIDVREVLSIADIPETLRGRFQEGGECGFDDESRFGPGGFDAGFDEGFRLLALPCGEGGAYNQPFAFFLERDGAFERLALPDMSEEGPTTVSQAWNIEWNHAARTLTAFFRGRGIGDCGSWNKWRLRTQMEGPAFVLKEARAKGDCDGNDAGGPLEWPATWPVAKK